MTDQQQTSKSIYDTREQWLKTAAGIVCQFYLADAGYAPRPDSYNISCGFARGRQRAPVAVTPREMSAGRRNEIFIAPTLNDSREVLVALTLGLVLAQRDCKPLPEGTRKMLGLPKIAKDGAVSGGSLKFHDMIDNLLTNALAGEPYPHQPLAPAKKCATRLLRMQCADSACGYNWRVTRKFADRTTMCPGCGHDKLMIGTRADDMEAFV